MNKSPVSAAFYDNRSTYKSLQKISFTSNYSNIQLALFFNICNVMTWLPCIQDRIHLVPVYCGLKSYLWLFLFGSNHTVKIAEGFLLPSSTDLSYFVWPKKIAVTLIWLVLKSNVEILCYWYMSDNIDESMYLLMLWEIVIMLMHTSLSLCFDPYMNNQSRNGYY